MHMTNVIRFPKFWFVHFKKAEDSNILNASDIKEIYAHSDFDAASIFLSLFIQEKMKNSNTGNMAGKIVVENMSDTIMCAEHSSLTNGAMNKSHISVDDIMKHYGSNIIDLVPNKN